MEVQRIKPHVIAFIPEGTKISQIGCNVGFIHTDEGVVLIDSSVSRNQMGNILEMMEIKASDVNLLINTHLHADHINGNALFRCPVVMHRKARALMSKKCAKLGQELITFDSHHRIKIGDDTLYLFHTGGHTPQSIVAWLSRAKVLFAGDLIFSGRAPFLASVTNFDTLVRALRWIPSLGAEVIVPGHGPLCKDDEALTQANYLETSWRIIDQRIKQGYSLNKILSDPSLPKPPGANFERNVEWIYKRCT